jgi:GNAT superfamily N-acetyltransferase
MDRDAVTAYWRRSIWIVEPGNALSARTAVRSSGTVGQRLWRAELQFRRAHADDRALLDEMTLAGLRYWGHHLQHPDAYHGLVDSLRREAGPERHPVFVLEDEGQALGFFELRERGDHVELLRMFLRTDLIGKGYGRLLWTEAVARADELHDRILIMSDPGASGFYEAMGATLEGEVEVSPGFRLGKFWYQLKPIS